MSILQQLDPSHSYIRQAPLGSVQRCNRCRALDLTMIANLGHQINPPPSWQSWRRGGDDLQLFPGESGRDKGKLLGAVGSCSKDPALPFVVLRMLSTPLHLPLSLFLFVCSGSYISPPCTFEHISCLTPSLTKDPSSRTTQNHSVTQRARQHLQQPTPVEKPPGRPRVQTDSHQPHYQPGLAGLIPTNHPCRRVYTGTPILWRAA